LEWAVGAGLVALSITHWQPMGIHLLELLSAFPHFTLGISLVIGALALVQKRWALLAATCFAVALNALLILSAPVSVPDTSIEADITVAQMNVYAENLIEHNLPADDLKNLDILSLQELNVNLHHNLLQTLEKLFPYRCDTLWDTCCYGIGLYSKWPITNCEDIGLFGVPIMQAEVLIDGKVVNVISMHTVPPAFPNRTEERNIQLRAVSKMASEFVGPCIVLGDFNLVPWDKEFKQFLKAANLSSVRDGFQATYPMDFGIPLIPIDYIIYSGNIVPTSCETVVIPGSDHRGMVAGFSFTDR
jgi:endonuclease/exonuclease/phosphatase (EEP) superfamily protein YafD